MRERHSSGKPFHVHNDELQNNIFNFVCKKVVNMFATISRITPLEILKTIRLIFFLSLLRPFVYDFFQMGSFQLDLFQISQLGLIVCKMFAANWIQFHWTGMRLCEIQTRSLVTSLLEASRKSPSKGCEKLKA